MTVFDLLILKSTRPLSCRQFSCEPSEAAQLDPPGVVGTILGEGYLSSSRRPAGSTLSNRYWFVGSTSGSPTKFGRGALQFDTPPAATAAASAEKSPDNSSAVGTQELRVNPRFSLFHSWL